VTPGNELKLGRAARHFNEASALLADYKNPRPFAIRRDENPDTGLSFWITLKRKPPDEIALAAGDCIHNLRSALDHIVYELSCHHRQQQHVGGTAFPVLTDPTNWDERDGKGKLRTSSGLHKLRAVPELALKRIELHQPYHGLEPMFWTRERLLHVHQLDIADKHRNLNLAVANVPENSVLYGHDGPPQKVIHVHKGRLNEAEDTLLLRFDPSVDVNVEVQPYAFVEVVFADRPVEDWEVRSTLQNLVIGVNAVLSEIRTFF
jgi:hypothetical protein